MICVTVQTAYVVVWIQNTGDVFCQVPVQHRLDVAANVDCQRKYIIIINLNLHIKYRLKVYCPQYQNVCVVVFEIFWMYLQVILDIGFSGRCLNVNIFIIIGVSILGGAASHVNIDIHRHQGTVLN